MPGLETTLQVLRESAGPWAVDAAIRALDRERDEKVLGGVIPLLLEIGGRRGRLTCIGAYHWLPEPMQARIRQEELTLLAALREAAAGPDAVVRLNVQEIVGRMDPPEAVRVAVEALEDASEDVRDRAVRTLLEFTERFLRWMHDAAARGGATPEAIEARRFAAADILLGALRGYARHHERQVLQCLLDLGGPAHEALAALLLDPAHAAYSDLRQSLRHYHSPGAVEFLFVLAGQREASLREIGRAVLSEPSGRLISRALAQYLERAGAAAAERPGVGWKEAPWIGLLEEHWADLTDRAWEALLLFIERGKFGPAPQAVVTRAALHCRFLEVRLRIVRVTDAMALEEALPALEVALKDPEEQVQMLAAETLIRRNPPDRTRWLTPLLSSPHEAVRHRVSKLLADDAFDRYMASFDRLDESTRAMAGRAIAKFDPEMAERLADELQSMDPQRRLKALRIAEIVDKRQELEPLLLELIADPDRKIRATVIKTIGLLGSIEAVKVLIQALSDPDRRMRANAVEAFEDIGSPKLANLLLPFLHDPDNRVRANAAKALYHLGRPETREVLEAMMEDPQELMRLSAVWAIGEVRYAGAEVRLEHAAAYDDSKTVRQKAAETLQRMRTSPAHGEGAA